jgi:hypothetical protein
MRLVVRLFLNNISDKFGNMESHATSFCYECTLSRLGNVLTGFDLLSETCTEAPMFFLSTGKVLMRRRETQRQVKSFVSTPPTTSHIDGLCRFYYAQL